MSLIRKLEKNGMSGKFYYLPPPPTILGKERLISDWNIVGECNIPSTHVLASLQVIS
jgi:hypothetical protein